MYALAHVHVCLVYMCVCVCVCVGGGGADEKEAHRRYLSPASRTRYGTHLIYMPNATTTVPVGTCTWRRLSVVDGGLAGLCAECVSVRESER